MTRYAVVRVNQDAHDTHAAEDVADAIALAMPDDGAFLEVQIVTARDAGAARLLAEPGRWTRWSGR